MNNKTDTLDSAKVLRKAIVTAIFTAFAVILPQIFHALGNVAGVSSAIGAMLLPMHIPVIAAGFLFGPTVGLAAGILSPIISHSISAMPTAALLPFITVELAFYGVFAGLLTRKSPYTFGKLISVQIIGRIARAIAVLFAFYVLGATKIQPASIIEFVKSGILGIVLQWAVITAIIKLSERNKE